MTSWGAKPQYYDRIYKNTLLVIAFIPLLAISTIELNTVPDVQISDNNAMSTKEISEDSIEKLLI